jgi:hypothetical protein
MPSTRGRIAAVALLASCCAGPALAYEYCVTCEGPPAMYRCVIDGTPEGAGKDSSSSLYCISQMAAKGRHETCSVARGAPFPCPGFTAVIAAPATPPMQEAPPSAAANAPPADAPPPHDQPPPAEQHAAEPAPPADTPAPVPRTVEELAGQTVKSSKEGIEKAGEAIGGTAKKAGEHISNAGSAIGNAASQTWNCITSLFSSCSPQEAPPPAPEPAPDEPQPN